MCCAGCRGGIKWLCLVMIAWSWSVLKHTGLSFASVHDLTRALQAGLEAATPLVRLSMVWYAWGFWVLFFALPVMIFWIAVWKGLGSSGWEFIGNCLKVFAALGSLPILASGFDLVLYALLLSWCFESHTSDLRLYLVMGAVFGVFEYIVVMRNVSFWILPTGCGMLWGVLVGYGMWRVQGSLWLMLERAGRTQPFLDS